ncbi:MAG: V-type ATPase 116kDa subunit family protein [Pseudomonadota bacterium]
MNFSLRPQPARWFELLTAREDLTLAVETLARTGAVELETHSETATPLVLPDLRGRLEEYNRLAQHYQRYWPQDELRPSNLPGRPVDTLNHALLRLYAWRDAADTLVRRNEALRGELYEVEMLREMLLAQNEITLDLGLLAGAGPALAARLFVLPPRTRIAQLPAAILHTSVHGKVHDFLLVVGPPAEVDLLEQELTLLKGRPMHLPAWLRRGTAASLAALDERAAAIHTEQDALEKQLAQVQEAHQLAEALGDIARLEWFLTHVEALPVSETFAWVTGWTSDLDGKVLQQALDRARARALLRFPDPPRDKTPPMVFHNPWWAQPFELFARLLGTPARDEADPSRLLVFIVPLMFGYMFGDLGQGLVLLLAGLLLARRFPTLRLLVPGGLASMLFGLLFGSVFSREDIIPPLWLHPLDQPLLVLAIPLLGGVLLLLLGLLLNGIEAYWRGALRDWLAMDAALLLIYLGLLGLLLTPYAALAALAGLFWYLGARLQRARGDLRVLGGAVGRLLEYTMQLIVNTLSFTRVGAFCLAHAGLSVAVVGLAEAGGHPLLSAIILLLGNGVIIILEGLVVSIQVTRLVLFEFFIRFLRGEGRRFQPLPAPSQRTQR